MKTVYLAGPITGLEAKEAAGGWRAIAEEYFKALGVKTLNPMRGQSDMTGILQPTDEDYGIHATNRNVLRNDFFDVQSADVVLANVTGAKRVSVGTTIEIAWCWALHKPCILCIEPDAGVNSPDRNLHEHAMLIEMIASREHTLNDALLRTARFLGV